MQPTRWLLLLCWLVQKVNVEEEYLPELWRTGLMSKLLRKDEKQKQPFPSDFRVGIGI
ncbi:hypothetical protein SCLCIDRAFT_1219339 [Scleroderma citrinum Foug A]|uniref:Uncharacterized protein n=1 Tax=Scleroderma citrinum Foug A TaxID=1036808 RepID=A0A0C3DAA9_9AGAM|nr:hypothetical protein SCLCIDRAFT_1219339 [Scleroderma citrinum Foug A]